MYLPKAAKYLSVVVLIAVIVAAVYFFTKKDSSGGYVELKPPDVTAPLPPSSSAMGQYSKAAVAANSEVCAAIGREILAKNGSAVDALISTMLCDGLSLPQAMGIGGGFVMTIYDKANKTAETLMSREVAPAAATRDMFKNDSMQSQDGPLAIAVPGEVKGYYEAWSRYGKLQWHELFEPIIKLCKEGIPVSSALETDVASIKDKVLANAALKNLLYKNGALVKAGDNITRPKLADTFTKIAYSQNLGDEFYNGSIADLIVKDIQDAGGIITKDDLIHYTPKWETPIVANLSGGLTMYSVPPPGSGILVGFLMRLLDGFVQNATTDLQVAQRITEAFKHAYGLRSCLGDPAFYNVTEIIDQLTSEQYIKQTRNKITDTSTSTDPIFYGAKYSTRSDHGTANIAVLAPNGDAAVATSTINLLFGSLFVSESTGIIFNNQMDDFSSTYDNFFGVPPSPANYIEPGKRPMSSMSPTVFVDSKGDVRLVVGSAGGTKITTSVTLVSINNLWFNKTIKEAVDSPRIHHQLMPMRFDYEYGVHRDVAKGMAEIGHEILRHESNEIWSSFVTAISRNANGVQCNTDFRRPGGVDGL